MDLTLKDRAKIRDLSRSIYDQWVMPPSLDQLNHILKSEPRNFATCGKEELAEFILNRFSQEEPLVKSLSAGNFEVLRRSIIRSYHSINFLDTCEGGTGTIVLTFMEIMKTFYTFHIQQGNKNLKNKEDKIFYGKYRWAFDQYSQLVYNQINQKAS